MPLQSPKRAATAIEKAIPAPIGGLNARDSLANMPPEDAVVLQNFYPTPSFVDTRGGTDLHLDQFPGIIKTLAVYSGIDGANTLWAFSEQGVAEVTHGGRAPYLGDYPNYLSPTRTNGKHQWCMFGDGTHNWLIAVNGVDKPFYWNGTSYTLVDAVSTPALTGITSTDIVNLMVYKQRLFFIRNNKLAFDYLPVGVAGGAVSSYDLSPFASDGGYLMAMGVWTRDAGNGPDDYAVFITSEGQALVYTGTNPASATDWSIVGTYKIGKPLGRRCILQFGADPVILTHDGAFELSTLLRTGEVRNQYALSDKIRPAFTDAARQYGSIFGWTLVSYVAKNALLVNVPRAENGAHEQYVMNTVSKAWCKFTGWDAEDIIVFNDELYYSQGGRIFKAWTGTSDNGANIEYVGKQAYGTYGYAGMKQPLQFMPILQSSRNISYLTGIDTDFSDRLEGPSTQTSLPRAGRWGQSTWGNAVWSATSQIVKNWGGTASWPGRWLSGNVRIVSDSISAQWVGSLIRFNVGNGL